MEALQTRLRIRQQRLNEAAETGKSLLLLCQAGGVPEEDFTRCRLKLKQSLEAFEKELYQFLARGGGDQNVDDLTNDQMIAEDVYTELEATSCLSKTKATAKLPKISLPTYSGDMLKWNEFWDRFNANVHQQDIADADKLSYLISCLDGTALEVVAGLSTTNANYALAVEALERRFGSKDLLIDAHYTALNKLPKATYTSSSCRSVLDSIECHLRVLEKLGEPVNGNHLRAMVLTKFPERIVHEHHLIGSEDNSLAAIRNNLHRIITAMEKSFVLDTTPPSVSTTEVLQTRSEVRPAVMKKQLKRKSPQDTTADAPPKKRAKRPCLFCKMSNHVSTACRKFKTVDERKAQISGRCLHCLQQNHQTEACKKKISCFRCKKDHLIMFCPEPAKGEPPSESTTIKTLCDVSNGYTFLQTAVAGIQNPESKTTRNIRVLLDSGSQRSYITKKTADLLKLPILKEDLLLIYTFGAIEPHRTSSPSTIINLHTKRGVNKKMQVNVVPQITDRLPPVSTFEYENVDILADDNTVEECIDLLVGNDYYSSFMRDRKLKIASNLYLLDTDFGWILSGNVAPEEVTDALSVVTYCQCHTPSCPYFTEPDLPLRNIDIKFLWSLESIGITDSPKATRQEEAVRHFNETVQYQDGRYEVKWPWIHFPPDLPANFGLALGRLRSVLKRMDGKSLVEYDSIIKEQLELGIIETCSPDSNQKDDHPVHYLPHHMVKQQGKRGRIVYDASAKTSGQKSLNECLYSGPSMLEDLTSLLLKFRTSRIGIMADVEKAFLQVGLQEEDRNVTRFLWIKDINKEPTDDNLLYLRFRRVPFGVISSPFLLTATIRYHMSQSGNNLLKAIADKCYVDNLVTGADSLLEAKEIYQQTRATFEQLSMNIRDWVSNDQRFLSIIPEQLKADDTKTAKVLGLHWDIEKDTLKLKVTENHFNPETKIDTKRKVLRTLSRIYDPCGMVCPLVLPLKTHFQNICELKAKWDTRLPDELVKSIETTLESLKAIRDIELPRYVGTEAAKEETKYYLHCFTDASKYAYAAVIYLKAVSQQKSYVSFLIAKCHISRAEDKDELKIPRLELLGFLIGSRLLKYARNNLNLTIQKEYLWTDSLVVLGWMNSNKLLPPFVANRIKEIKQSHPQTEMYYVQSKFNPADIATRPELFEEKRELWYSGPEFLQKDESSWPDNRHYDTHMTFFSVREALGVDSVEPREPRESEPGVSHGEPAEYNTDPSVPMELDRCDPGEPIQESSETQDETLSGMVAEIKKIQSKYFPDELTGKRTHLARNLDLFLDIDGVLRCGGRMTNTTWNYDMKYPILLPKDSELTEKIIKDTHVSNYHVGASHTLSIIRERYWIPQGKAQVQKVLRRCPQCIKHGGGPYKLPATPALPPERVNYSEPFTYTGIDYFGPLYVDTETGQKKIWAALFTCLTVRAIHLEIVKDLSAEECLLAIRRFAATRGIPKKMYSDNATYFKLVSEVMAKPYCIDKKIQWKFIPQLAPWHGGFYERLVGLVKHCVKRTLEKHLLTESQTMTVMKEVEAVVNSRPLTKVGTEINHILRPVDFLTLGKCLTTNPSSEQSPSTGTTTKIDLIRSWKRGLRIMDEFKRMFIGQYLLCLRERYNHTPKQPRIKSDRTPEVGDLVQLKSDNKNRNRWKTGKIVSLVEGRDGEHRVANVQVEDNILTRSVGHLYPLEADDGPQQNDAMQTDVAPMQDLILERDDSMIPKPSEVLDEPVNPESDPVATAPVEVTSPDEQSEGVEARSRRDAAVRAREKILAWTRHLLTLLD